MLATGAGALALGAALLGSRAVALALGAGAAVQALVCLAAVCGRRSLISKLALEPAAYALDEVERYGQRVLGQRHRLAAWLAALVNEATYPGTPYLVHRVRRHAADFESLARELGSPRARVRPTSAVACRRLLTHAVESPLYNPRIPSDDLVSALNRIRSGIDVG